MRKNAQRVVALLLALVLTLSLALSLFGCDANKPEDSDSPHGVDGPVIGDPTAEEGENFVPFFKTFATMGSQHIAKEGRGYYAQYAQTIGEGYKLYIPVDSVPAGNALFSMIYLDNFVVEVIATKTEEGVYKAYMNVCSSCILEDLCIYIQATPGCLQCLNCHHNYYFDGSGENDDICGPIEIPASGFGLEEIGVRHCDTMSYPWLDPMNDADVYNTTTFDYENDAGLNAIVIPYDTLRGVCDRLETMLITQDLGEVCTPVTSD